MAADKCKHCGQIFVKGNKSYRRYSTTSKVLGRQISDFLDNEITSMEKSFVCDTCFRAFKRAIAANDELRKRKTVPSASTTPQICKKMKVDRSSPQVAVVKSSRKTWKHGLLNKVRKSRYISAMKGMYAQMTSRQAILDYVKRACRQEGKDYASMQRTLSWKTSSSSIHNFSWSEAIHELSSVMPITMSAISGAMCLKSHEAKKLNCDNGKIGSSVPGLGMIFAIMMYCRKPQTFNFIQNLISLELFNSGCNQKVIQSFQHIGLCKGVKGTINAVDNIKTEFDHEIMTWKNGIKDELCAGCDADDVVAEVLALEDGSQNGIACEEIDENIDSTDIQQIDMAAASDTDDNTVLQYDDDSDFSNNINCDELHPGFAVVWDNVQLQSIARHQSIDNVNMFHMWALAYAARNRISFRHLNDSNSVLARNLSFHTFLPTQTDYERYRDRMLIIVKRILKQHLPVFIDERVVDHIPHKYQDESSIKSRLVNLGVYEENPSSTAGVIAIMDRLHNYVPQTDQDIFTILCHGDGLSVERMRDARAARAASNTVSGRLQGLEPTPQEFHKRCILLQIKMWKLDWWVHGWCYNLDH